MADLLDRLHIDAFLDRLRLDTGPPALKVYPDAEGNVPINPVPPYVRTYFTIDRPIESGANSVVGVSSAWTTRAYTHCVGLNEYSAAAIRMRVRVAWLDFRPTIAGRSCGLIRHEASQPPQRDEGTGVLVVDMADVWRLLTTA